MGAVIRTCASCGVNLTYNGVTACLVLKNRNDIYLSIDYSKYRGEEISKRLAEFNLTEEDQGRLSSQIMSFIFKRDSHASS